MSYSVYLIILGLIAAVVVSGAVVFWRRRRAHGTLSLAAFMAAVALWAVCDLLAAVSPNADWAYRFDSQLRFAAVAGCSVLILLVALDVTGRAGWLRPRRILLLSLIPLATQLVIWLGPPDAFIVEAVYGKRDGFYVLEARSFGPWFTVHAVYGYILIGAGLTLLLRCAFKTLKPYREQALLLFFGLLIVAVISVARLFGRGVLLEYDWIAVGFGATAIVWGIALGRFRLFDLTPVARDTLIEVMDDVVIVLDAQSRVVDLNPAAQQALGWNPDRVIGQPVDVVMEGWSLEQNGLHGGVHNGQAEVTLGGRVFDLRLSPLRSHGEQIVGWLLVLRDITDRRRMLVTITEGAESTRVFQQKLVALHEVTVELAQIDSIPALYRRAIELARERLGYERIGLFMIDEDDPTMMVGAFGIDPKGNLRDERATRLPIDENDRIRVALDEKVRFAVWEGGTLWDEQQSVGQGWNAMATLWNGSEGIGWLVADNLLTGQPLTPYTLELMALYGSTLGYLITNLRTQIALRNSEARFRRLSEASFEGIIIHENGIILDTNRAFAAMFGREPRDLIGTNVMNVATPESRGVIAAQMTSGAEDVYEAVGLRKDGTTFPVEIHARTVPYYDRKIRVAAVRDLTLRKQAEQQSIDLALQKERVKMLANFITSATHEFRTPLSIINTRVFLLRKEGAIEMKTEHLDIIAEQVRSLSALVDALVAMSRLDGGTDVPLAVSEINGVLKLLCANMRDVFMRHDVTLVVLLGEDPLPVRCDTNLLSQAVSNLLENALRYTPPGGVVTVEVARCDGQVVVTVSDTGIGMTPDQQQRAFERFYRVDEAHSTRGFGLGLPIAQRIVDLHGGYITLESTPGIGSAFTVHLPVAVESVESGEHL